MTRTVHDAIILAGGRGARLGGDKASVVVTGQRLVDHVLDAASGARRVVVVGPPGLLDATVDGDRVLITREDPPFGGPAAGLAAGLALLGEAAAASGCTTDVPVLLLACDVPLVGGLVDVLLDEWASRSRAAGSPVDGVCASLDGRAQWLAGVYAPAALQRATAVAGGTTHDLVGMPLRRVMEHLGLVLLDDPARLSTDVDSWDDVERVSLLSQGPHPTDPPGGLR